METNIAQNVGVDICKATLDVHLHPAGAARQFANDANGIKALLGWLADRPIARVVFEPTGRYHHAFERQLGSAGLPLAKVNPRQARRFGQRPKFILSDAAGSVEGPRRSAAMPKPMLSMPPCWRAWAHCSSCHRSRSPATPWTP